MVVVDNPDRKITRGRWVARLGKRGSGNDRDNVKCDVILANVRLKVRSATQVNVGVFAYGPTPESQEHVKHNTI